MFSVIKLVIMLIWTAFNVVLCILGVKFSEMFLFIALFSILLQGYAVFDDWNS